MRFIWDGLCFVVLFVLTMSVVVPKEILLFSLCFLKAVKLSITLAFGVSDFFKKQVKSLLNQLPKLLSLLKRKLVFSLLRCYLKWSE